MELNQQHKYFIVRSDFFDQIESAVDYNHASSMGWAKRQLKLVLNAFLEGKSLVIEDLGIELKNLEAYKKWKGTRDKLNVFNSDELIKEIKLSNARIKQLINETDE